MASIRVCLANSSKLKSPSGRYQVLDQPIAPAINRRRMNGSCCIRPASLPSAIMLSHKASYSLRNFNINGCFPYSGFAIRKPKHS